MPVCVERKFHLSDNDPATVERVFAACQTEEQAYLSAVAVVMQATVEPRFIVDRYKLDLKWRLL